MGYPSLVDYPLCVVQQNNSESDAVDLGRAALIGVSVPAALEATTVQISFKAATTLAGTYKVVKQGGAKLVLTIAVSDFALLANVADLSGVRFVKLVLENSAGTPVAQATASRTFELITNLWE